MPFERHGGARDIVLAVAQHHGIEVAFRRLVADQKREAFFPAPD
jgi:hypothetical protein